MNNKNSMPAKGSQMAPQKSKNFKKAWGDLLNYCKKFYGVIVISTLFAIGGTVLTLIGPNKVGDLTNIITSGMFSPNNIDLSAVVNLSIILIIIYVLSSILSYLQGYLMAGATQKISKNLRGDISKKINKLPLKFLDSTSTGDILSRVTNDVGTISQSLFDSTASLIGNIVLLLGSVLMMFLTNWIMAIASICASLIGFFIMFLIIKKSQKYFIMQQQLLGDLNGHIEESYTGHNTIKCYNGEQFVKEKFAKTNNKLYLCAWKSQFFSGLMMPLMDFVGNFGFVVVCVLGAVLCSNNSIEFGVIVSFMIYIRLFMQPLSQIAQAATNLQSTAAASERVFEFLNEQEQPDESNVEFKLENIQGNVEFQNVKFGYDKDKIIIKDFSATVKSGQKVAIVGPTGAGKTTMVNLLMKFYQVDSGEILIDNIPISKVSRENVHKIFSMVLQDTWIFEGTIKENIVYAKENVTDEQVENACKAVGLDHFIKTLPKGYNTVLNDETAISSGQKQLLTIARAMVQNSPMLILDEATSSVDTRTEIQIQKAMDKLTKNRTSFVIAHRLSTIKNADLILVMKDGNVIEKGTHAKLMKEKGFYYNLYNSQFTKKGCATTD